jgi:hypothetical protein
MMWRMAVVAVGMACAAAAQAGAPGLPSSPFGYAVFAIGDVTLQNKVRGVNGDVGSNGGRVLVGKDTPVLGAVAGPRVTLRKDARAGSLFCLLLEGPGGGACQAVTIPLVPTAQLPAVQVVPGTVSLRVPPKGRRSPVAPGAYADVRIGPRGLLVLAGGTYAVRSIRIQPRGQLLCQDACRIGVANRVRLQPRAVLTGTRPSDVHVDVARTASSPVFAAAPRATVGALVYAPGGRIDLRNQGNYVGAFVGKTVTVGMGAIVDAGGP